MFIDRIAEYKTLEEQYNLNSSSFVVIYGRRRTGKTTLINKFLNDKGNGLYFLATEESEKTNLQNFRSLVADFTNNDLLAISEADWITVFKKIVESSSSKKSKTIIVIDEFQYIGKSNLSFMSIMQKAWDTVLKDANIMLIICGSIIVSMKRQALDYDSPLYGRRTAQIKMKQIRFQYYSQFFNSLSNRQLIERYAITGGVPKYIESLTNNKDIFKIIQTSIINTQSYLYEEPLFLLQSEVSEVGTYFSLIRAIAMGNRKLADIAQALRVVQSSLSKYLQVLIELDILERRVPATDQNPEKSKSGLYFIKDNYLSFWFKFVYPYRSFLERGETDYVIDKVKEGFIQNHVSYVFEDICRDSVIEICKQKQLGFLPSIVGSYWGKACGETDIVAYTPGEETLIIGECKYSTSEKGLDVLHKMEEKSQILMALTKTRIVKYLIFSTGSFSKGLKDKERNSDSLFLISV